MCADGSRKEAAECGSGAEFRGNQRATRVASNAWRETGGKGHKVHQITAFDNFPAEMRANGGSCLRTSASAHLCDGVLTKAHEISSGKVFIVRRRSESHKTDVRRKRGYVHEEEEQEGEEEEEGKSLIFAPAAPIFINESATLRVPRGTSVRVRVRPAAAALGEEEEKSKEGEEEVSCPESSCKCTAEEEKRGGSPAPESPAAEQPAPSLPLSPPLSVFLSLSLSLPPPLSPSLPPTLSLTLSLSLSGNKISQTHFSQSTSLCLMSCSHFTHVLYINNCARVVGRVNQNFLKHLNVNKYEDLSFFGHQDGRTSLALTLKDYSVFLSSVNLNCSNNRSNNCSNNCSVHFITVTNYFYFHQRAPKPIGCNVSIDHRRAPQLTICRIIQWFSYIWIICVFKTT